MKKRGKIRASVLLSALLLVLCGLWADSQKTLNSSRMALEYSYRRALNDLTDYVSGMRSTLQKAPYVNTAVMQNTVSAKLLEQSGGAKAAMAVLPFSQEKTDKISRFLSQTGDYALSLSRRSAAGQGREDQDLENLAALEEYAGKLSDALQKAQARLSTENLSINRITSELNNVESLSGLPSLDNDFDEVAEAFAQFPALLYDGPFSDHIRRREPLFLQNEREISREEAAKKAAAFLNCSSDELEFKGEGGSQLPVFSFTCGDSHVNITKAGGQAAYFKKGGEIPSAQLDYVDALIEAARILKEMGIPSFRESYYVISDNLCTINFAGTTSLDGADVTCYPDLIKVTIELNEGGMVEYDATGYLMNHHERELAAPALTEEQAAQSLSPRLTVKTANLALIPTPGLDEVLCWEFHCTSSSGAEAGSKQEFLVYINGETGQEEQLYLLQEDEHGVLVM